MWLGLYYQPLKINYASVVYDYKPQTRKMNSNDDKMSSIKNVDKLWDVSVKNASTSTVGVEFHLII